MSQSVPIPVSLDDWIAREVIGFSVDSSETLNAAIDRMMSALSDSPGNSGDESVDLLGLGEALHGGEEILILRNRLFARLVQQHGYSAIAVESSCSRAHVVNEYLEQGSATSYEQVREAGFSHGFGRLEANRQLLHWMREYNRGIAADGSHRGVKLRFYGFDSPTEMTGTDSPRQLLHLVLNYLAEMNGETDAARGRERRRRIDTLLGDDAAWENPAAMMDPTKSVGLSPAAAALRIEVEDLATELRVRRPELVRKSDAGRWLDVAQHASVARQLLGYHATLARPSDGRIAEALGLRDAMMADNLAYAVARERGRGKVLAFAHNSHLKRGQAHWQLGPHALAWWPAGAQLAEMLGPRYSVIGSGVGVSEANGIGPPEPGTLEALLTANQVLGPTGRGARFIPTHCARGFAVSDIAALPTRSGSAKNSTYFPLTAQSLSDFDWLAVVDSTTYSRGGPALP